MAKDNVYRLLRALRKKNSTLGGCAQVIPTFDMASILAIFFNI
jgi:hypothetical protein